MRTLKFILLPVFGVLAALIAFRLAAPFEGTLSHSDLGSEDARALYTYGTKWGEVNRIAFGALLCGPFAVVLALGRQSLARVVAAGVVGAAMGGLVNFITDSSADLIGIALSSHAPAFGSLMAMLAWCFLVPAGIALTLVFAQGISPQRIKRAMFAFRITAVSCFVVQMIGGMLAVQDANGEVNLQSQIPVWRLVEAAVGFAFGVTILLADEWIRTGTIRLMHGKNEFTDWSLDYTTNRIGSAEGSEIYVRGFQGVEPLHATISRQGDYFMLEASATTLVNGQAVARVPLKSSDVITVGNAQLVYRSNGVVDGFVAPAQPVQIQQASAYVPAVSGQAKILQDAFGQQIPLVPGRYGIGRDSTNAICLYNDPIVSSNHADLIVTLTDLVISDLRSAAGTKVNGMQITAPTNLRLGDVVEIGASRFSYVR